MSEKSAPHVETPLSLDVDCLMQNLACVAQRSPRLYSQLQGYHIQQGAARYRCLRGRKGGVSMQLRGDGWIWMYSAVDPQTEAARAATQMATQAGARTAGARDEQRRGAQAAGTPPMLIVATVLGNGYLIEELLSHVKTADIVVISPDTELLAYSLSTRDMRALLQCERFTIRWADSIADAQALVQRLYMPALHGMAHVIENDPLARHIPEQRALLHAIRRSVADAYGALSVYRKLGRVWFRNMLTNGKDITDLHTVARVAVVRPTRAAVVHPTRAAVAPSSFDIPRRARVAVVAAGPSLDNQIPLLRAAQQRYNTDEYALISTDTALPALKRHGISVSACVTLDCQLYTYLHFVDAAAYAPLLYADLATHPILGRMRRSVIHMGSAHPLSLLLERALPLHPLLSRCEHVTHSAFAIAVAHRPDTIALYGADYAYLSGKGYARGTYIPEYHLIRSHYLSPYELQSLAFTWRYNERPSTIRQAGKIVPYFLLAYRKQLFRYAAEQGYADWEEQEGGALFFAKRQRLGGDADGDAAADADVEADGDADVEADGDAAADVPRAAARSELSWEALISRYQRSVRDLPTPVPPYIRYVERLNDDELLTLLSLLPLMVHIQHSKRWQAEGVGAAAKAGADTTGTEDGGGAADITALFARMRTEALRQLATNSSRVLRAGRAHQVVV